MTGLPDGAIMLVDGDFDAPLLQLDEPLSFWGGFDAPTGRVIDRRHPQHGMILTGVVLMLSEARGSSSGSSVLAEAIRLKTAPAAILLRKRDAIIVTAALVARELYGIACPVAVIPDEDDWRRLGALERLNRSGALPR
ncbi:MAG: aconitase X swivel domain-containing protein [Beijerinckiaceae bacterium]